MSKKLERRLCCIARCCHNFLLLPYPLSLARLYEGEDSRIVVNLLWSSKSGLVTLSFFLCIMTFFSHPCKPFSLALGLAVGFSHVHSRSPSFRSCIIPQIGLSEMRETAQRRGQTDDKRNECALKFDGVSAHLT